MNLLQNTVSFNFNDEFGVRFLQGCLELNTQVYQAFVG